VQARINEAVNDGAVSVSIPALFSRMQPTLGSAVTCVLWPVECICVTLASASIAIAAQRTQRHEIDRRAI
jgi:hypothetical protein